MKKAIFTNIKNEHRYIEAWIEYHIRLGINTFILYEDEGSITHEDIISKYSNVCDIDFYDYVLKKDSLEFKDLTCFKHLFENYSDIDWLIKLDPDEFIVLPNKCTTIDDILFINQEVNQIFIPWKLYNANGFINQPYEGKYNIFDTYLVPIKQDDLEFGFKANVSENKYNFGKSFINYKKYKKDFNSILNIDSLAVEFPYMIFNDENTSIISGLYINHYITKSFEEFYDKLKNKGEYNINRYRKLGDFFVLNPDLIKEIPMIEEKYNVNIFEFETKLNVNLNKNGNQEY